jgi:rhodanese-related sulfurtransferase
MSRIEKVILLFLIIACSIIAPIAFYLFSNVPTVSPGEAKYLLKKEPFNTLLLDMRSRRDFDRVHINPSFNIPYNDLLDNNITDDQKAAIKGKTIFILCDSGIASAEVTRKLINSRINAFNIKGGLGAWIADAGKVFTDVTSLETHPGEEVLFPFRIAPSHEQWLAVLTGYGIKPFYTTLSFILIIILLKKNEIELKTLKYSMIFFFIGENFCAVNYLFFNHESYLFEYFHSLGMVISFGFVAYALFEGVDKYVFNYSDLLKKCAFLGVCEKCIKYEEVSCALKQIFIFLCFSASAISLMPLFAKLKMVSYNTEIWKTLYNYSHPVVYQLFEVRYCPIFASAAFLSVGLTLLAKKATPLPVIKIVTASAFGAAGFSFFRFILFHAYRDNLVWMEFWEEITKFIFIIGVAFLLWLFRRTFFGLK